MLTLIKNDPTNSGFTLPTFDRAEQDRARAEKQAQVDSLIAELKAANPWAVPESTKCSGVARASKNLKKQLTLLFPGTKFSVKSERFSMGDSIHVSYTDGPAYSLVEPVVKAYQAGTFDGMQDLYEYDSSVGAKARDIVFGDTKYASVERLISREVRESLCDWTEAKFGRRFTVETSKDGAYSWFGRDLDPTREDTAYIHRAVTELLAATSF